MIIIPHLSVMLVLPLVTSVSCWSSNTSLSRVAQRFLNAITNIGCDSDDEILMERYPKQNEKKKKESQKQQQHITRYAEATCQLLYTPAGNVKCTLS